MNSKKLKIYITCVLLGMLVSLTSCKLDEVPNPNGPSLESLENGASLADLRLLATGLESTMRFDMSFYYQTVSIVGREYYDLNAIDPRYTTELIGQQDVLDNNGFLTTRAFAANYKAVRLAEVLLTATENSIAGLTSEQNNGIQGYAKTLKAYSLLLSANRQYNCGIRVDVADPDNLGPFTGSYQESLTSIATLLNEANANLNTGGGSFAFTLSGGFAGFDTPGTFSQFNRAIAARVALYRKAPAAEVDGILGNSFMDLAGSMTKGVFHIFGAGGNDILNPLFYVPNQDLYTINSAYDAFLTDPRLDAKTTPLDPASVGVPVLVDGLSGSVQVTMYASNTDPVPIIRNEELLYISAEANLSTNNTKALAAVNAVRDAYGLTPLTGTLTINQLLREKSLSLFGEGHRWIDARRNGKLGDLPNDRTGDKVFASFPRPIVEGSTCP